MKHSLAWIEKFIASDKQSEVALLSPEKQFETLCGLIETGKIEVAAYLAWASQFFLLPSLDSQFFVHVDTQVVWKKYSGLNFWNSQIFPVGEWENRLMIATFAPPTEFNPSFAEAPIFVLASPIDLKKTWAKLNPTVASPKLESPKLESPKIAPAKAVVMPPQSVVAPAQESPMRFSMNIDSGFKTIELGSETLDVSEKMLSEKIVEETSDSPNGLNLDLDFTKTSAPKFSFGAPKATSKEETRPERVAEPIAPPVVKPAAPTLELTLDEPLLAPPPKVPPAQAKPIGPPLQTKPIGPPVMSAPPAPPPKAQAPPAPPTPKPIVVEAVKPVLPPPVIAKPAIAKPAVAQKSLGFKSDIKRDLSAAKSSFEECTNYAETADAMFAKMLPQFEMSMLLMCENQSLKPAFWSGNFKVNDEQKPKPIALQQASIFKIVHSSGKPYHGYLVANHTNSQFFNEWNAGEIPKHVTLFPIFVNKDLIGIWFGASNNSIDLKTSLIDMDSLTDQSVVAIQTLTKKAA